jgi:hypothetical protein
MTLSPGARLGPYEVLSPPEGNSGAAPDPLSRARPDGGLDRYT